MEQFPNQLYSSCYPCSYSYNTYSQENCYPNNCVNTYSNYYPTDPNYTNNSYSNCCPSYTNPCNSCPSPQPPCSPPPQSCTSTTDEAYCSPTALKQVEIIKHIICAFSRELQGLETLLPKIIFLFKTAFPGLSEDSLLVLVKLLPQPFQGIAQTLVKAWSVSSKKTS